MWYLRLIWLLLFLTQCGSGCTPATLRPQAVAAHTVARVANAAGKQLAEQMRRQGSDAIDLAASAAEARAALELVEDQWRPVWAAHDELAIVHEAYAEQLEAGGDVDLEALVDSYCELRAVALDSVQVALPDVPTGGCS